MRQSIHAWVFHCVFEFSPFLYVITILLALFIFHMIDSLDDISWGFRLHISKALWLQNPIQREKIHILILTIYSILSFFVLYFWVCWCVCACMFVASWMAWMQQTCTPTIYTSFNLLIRTIVVVLLVFLFPQTVRLDHLPCIYIYGSWVLCSALTVHWILFVRLYISLLFICGAMVFTIYYIKRVCVLLLSTLSNIIRSVKNTIHGRLKKMVHEFSFNKPSKVVGRI